MMPDRVRVWNKYVTNRVLRVLTFCSHGPFARLRHVGRRSGKRYETVLMVWPTGAGFVIALTYGPKVDWYRNLVAAGDATLMWHRHTYEIGNLERIDAQSALPVFPTPIRQILKMVGLQDFVHISIESRQ